MEILKNYLETMFVSLPNTREVLKAKQELLQMMEDKYNELKAEGHPENEAVSTVLAEFGNLDEVAESLGIKEVVKKAPVDKRMVSKDEAVEYINSRNKAAVSIAVGVGLCILSVCGFIFFGSMIGTLFMFTSIGVGVGLMIFTGVEHSRYDYMEKISCAVDFSTIDYIDKEREKYRPLKALLISIGVFLLVFFIPMEGIIDYFNFSFGGAAFFTCVALGVGFLIYANVKDAAYERLLKLNDSKTIGGNYTDYQKKNSNLTKTGQAVLAVYWPTVLCIYLCVSFLFGHWSLTWLIWIAAIVFKNLFEVIFTEEKNDEMKETK